MDTAKGGKRDAKAPAFRAVKGDTSPEAELHDADSGAGSDPSPPSEAQAAPSSADPGSRSAATQALAPSPSRPGYTARKSRPDALKRIAPKPTAAAAEAGPAKIQPVAGPATIKKRHRGIMWSFVALVILPIVVAAAYLWMVAKDQYASTVAFSIRKEELSSSLDLLGGITKLSGGGSSDTDVLYDFIRSQGLVAEIDRELDLGRIYGAEWPEDPIFSYDPSGTIEDLLRHWKRKVQITYDTGTGLMTLRVLAFDPVDATAIATKILEESTRMINALSADAREDATSYARLELEHAVERLKQARSDLTAFRLRSQIVDPQADLQGQMGVLNNLQAQLADSLVELDLLRTSARDDDPRIQKATRRIEVIENRIVAEREKFGIGGQGPGGEDYATLVAEFERLTVDREFAEETYRAALVSYDAALAEAKRKSLYLAAHIQPTMAERSDFPRRWTLQALTSFFLLMAWAIGVLIYYSIRDRR
ncbi:sugar transporter [Sulfitobacter sabulilitoris]|uniref:Sugar transporter n=1 Tax=Sulfitobacter sabulilitoris TaxID=2562655 RepID=A0A5S3P7K8_9RHOB|nr:sugar transporter [Sulfitobacter sabulilitoris]TMM49371.1 sugar transporter [Sulfitobacter sabulilitoris]